MALATRSSRIALAPRGSWLALVLAGTLVAALPARAQVVSPAPTVVDAARVSTSVPLREMEPVPLAPYRGGVPFVIPNQFHRFNGRINDLGGPPVEDPAADRGEAQRGADTPIGTTLLSVPGASADVVEAATGGRGAPPDPSGDVGPNHYVQMVNSATSIYNRAGTLLLPTFPNNQFFAGMGGICETTNRGDPIVVYDEYADRWLVSQFAFNTSTAAPYAMCIAVSATPDPTGAYHRYEFPWSHFPDYPKLGVWRDGYTMMITAFSTGNNTFLYSEAVMLERNQMLQGLPARSIRFNTTTTGGFTLGYGVLPSDADGGLPPVGTPAIFIDRAVAASIDVYGLTANWTTPANSTFTRLARVPTAAYNERTARIPQPGTGTTLDVLSGHNMFRLQYRNRGTYGALLFNHDADVAGQAGTRWYELRDGGTGTWAVHQQGTYVPAGGLHRWMGSIAMNGAGDIGLAYSVSSSTVFPSLRFTGQTSDQSGTGLMNVPETVLHAGGGSQTNPTRWGDYSQLAVDPTDNTFWYTNEYYAANGSFDWATRIARFAIGGALAPPGLSVTPSALSVAVAAGSTTTRTVTVSNTAAVGAADLNVAASVQNASGRPGADGAAVALAVAPAVPAAKGTSASDGTGTASRTGGPDAFGYRFADSTEPGGPVYAFTDISGTGTAVTLGDDAASAALPLGFSFPFYGTNYTTVFIGSNGILTFGSGTNVLDNTAIPTAGTPNTFVAPFWDDLAPNLGGTIRYQTVGGNFVVQFTNVPRYFSGTNPAPSGSVSFQAILKPSGEVVFQYQAIPTITNSATIGIENQAGSTGLQVAFNEAYVAPSLAVRFTPGPPPPPPLATVAPASLSIPAGTSQTFTVTFNATGRTEGTYTADLVLTSNAPGTGTATVPLTLTVSGSNVVTGAPGWRLLAPAASGMTVSSLAALNHVQGYPGHFPTGTPNVLTYNGSAYVPVATSLAPGRGFWWLFYDASAFPGGPPAGHDQLPTTLTSSGTPVTTDTGVALSAAGNGFNVLGNPFGVSLNVSNVSTWPGASNLRSFVVQAWNAGSGTYENSVTRPTLSPWQGFWAEAQTAGTLTIPASARTTGGVLLRGDGDALGTDALVAFELAQADGPLRDHAAVLVLGDGRSADQDPGDAVKLSPFSTAHVVLAFGEGEALRSVESRPVEALTLPMGVASIGAGADLVLTWPRVEGLPDGWAATLRDTETGTTVDLAEAASYAFRVVPEAARPSDEAPVVARAAAMAARFVLTVGPRAVAAEGGPAFALALDTPFPNPTNERAQVSFSLAEAGAARLSVVDLLGREVAVLTDEERAAGAHTATLDASRLAPGVYVVRLVAGGEALTRRIVVIH